MPDLSVTAAGGAVRKFATAAGHHPDRAPQLVRGYTGDRMDLSRRIDPATGRLLGRVDLNSLVEDEVGRGEDNRVLNGIAYDAALRRDLGRDVAADLGQGFYTERAVGEVEAEVGLVAAGKVGGGFDDGAVEGDDRLGRLADDVRKAGRIGCDACNLMAFQRDIHFVLEPACMARLAGHARDQSEPCPPVRPSG